MGPVFVDLEPKFGEKRFAQALPRLEEVRKYLDERRS
jgi:hypothetical protein